MRERKRASRRSAATARRRRRSDGNPASQPAGVPMPAPPAGAAPTSEAMLDEPASSRPEESPETDIAPTVLGHGGVERPESVETDVSPAALDDAGPEDLR